MRANWFTAAIVVGIAAIVLAAIAMRLSYGRVKNPRTRLVPLA